MTILQVNKPSRFEVTWVGAKGCEDIIKNYWQSIDHFDSVTEIMSDISSCNQHLKLLHSCSGVLKKWAKNKDSNRGKEIKRLTMKIKKLQDNEGLENVEEIRELQNEVRVLLVQEDVKWRQKAKRNLYRLSDKNTKFFHASAT
ncbi:hypothetical protein F2P56_033057 [Juglans regia]|uniref:Uncharacterized protein n=2 Tax=Juglans regia TaxID=51240 RepID=A0A833WX90_JUGRE|nr:uncharacterized protein LOC108985841 [Juglans regia]KAF5447506.1 hypothetical protein F2P56_033057 [Juglans regia]